MSCEFAYDGYEHLSQEEIDERAIKFGKPQDIVVMPDKQAVMEVPELRMPRKPAK